MFNELTLSLNGNGSIVWRRCSCENGATVLKKFIFFLKFCTESVVFVKEDGFFILRRVPGIFHVDKGRKFLFQ